MIERRTKMGVNASTRQEPTFCQQCEREKWNGYYMHFNGLEFGVFVCDDCLKASKAVTA